MDTYFVEIVHNNISKYFPGTRYLRCVVLAKNDEQAKEKALNHYKPYYSGGEEGRFYVQCCWTASIPTRECIEKHWKKASESKGVINAASEMGEERYHYFQVDKTKKEVLATWDYLNCSWAAPSVYYDPQKGGYMVALHNYMCMPSEFILFKGATKEVYDEALKFVEDNTLKKDYFMKF